MSVKNHKLLNEYVDKVIRLELQESEDLPSRLDDVIMEAVNRLQSLRIQDLKELELAIKSKHLQLHEENQIIDSTELRKFKLSELIINQSIEKRKESHRRPSYPMNKNLLDHGVYWAGKTRKKKSPDELTFDAKIIRNKNGLKALKYQNDRGQLLSLFDTRVFLGLHKLWERKGKQKEFNFHDWELLDVINLGKSGKHYEMLDESLKTLYATSVVMQEFYFDKGKAKRIVTEQFHLLQSRGDDITLREDGKIRSTLHRIQFSDYLQGSLIGGYISQISLAMLEDLDTETAQGLYLMMNSMVLNKEGYYELPVETICEHIGITPDRPIRIKNTLGKACDQLLKTEIIKERTFHQDDNKITYLRLYPSEWFRSLNESESIQQSSNEQLNLLL